jgi:glycosyltransferase involved in cell wall biosynthesis
VLNQSYTNIEVIVVDDCSTDNSYLVLQNIQSIDNRLKILRNNFNYGVSFARNLGIKYSTGEYICFLDSDDFWTFDKIEKQLSFMIENNYNLTYTYYTVFHANSFKLINNLYEIILEFLCIKNILNLNWYLF